MTELRELEDKKTNGECPICGSDKEVDFYEDDRKGNWRKYDVRVGCTSCDWRTWIEKSVEVLEEE